MDPSRRRRRRPSFFKVFLDRSADHLPLPTDFVRKHLKNKIPENPILKSVNGGCSWKLKIQKVDGIYSFVDGWNKVVEDMQLVFGDFLVFWLVYHSTFEVVIFGTNGCEKNKKVISDFDEDDDGGSDIDQDVGDPFFTKVISEEDTFALRFPWEFACLVRWNAGRTINMKNLDGNEWPIRLLLEGRHYRRYYLSAGWSVFRRANELCVGDKCVFKYLRSEDKFLLAEVTKKRVPAKQPTGKVPEAQVSKRPRGRPRRVEVVEKKLQSEKAPVLAEDLKRKRGRPQRCVEAVEKMVQSKNAPVGEELRRPKGRPRRVEVAEKKLHSKNAPVGEELKRKRGLPKRVEVEMERKDDGVKVVKRPRGRPFKKKRGRPALMISKPS